jgi:hypothetical protein
MWTQREMQVFLLFAVEGATHNIHLDFPIVKALFADLLAEEVTIKAAETALMAETALLAEPVDQVVIASSGESVEDLVGERCNVQLTTPPHSACNSEHGGEANIKI